MTAPLRPTGSSTATPVHRSQPVHPHVQELAENPSGAGHLAGVHGFEMHGLGLFGSESVARQLGVQP